MNAYFQLRIEMIRRTEQLLLTHQNIFQQDVRFQEVFGELQSRLAALELRIDALLDNSAPLGPRKNKLRDTIRQKASVLHDMIFLATEEVGDLTSMAALKGNKNYSSMGYTDLVERVQFLMRKAHALKTILDKYSSSAPMMAELTTALDAFQRAENNPKGTIVQNAIERKAIYMEIKNLAELIRGPIKTVVRTKATEDPDFFSLFKAYSRISGLAINGGTSKKEMSEEAETEEVATEAAAAGASETTAASTATEVTPEDAAAPAVATEAAATEAAAPATAEAGMPAATDASTPVATETSPPAASATEVASTEAKKAAEPTGKTTSGNKSAAKKAASTKTANGQAALAETS